MDHRRKKVTARSLSSVIGVTLSIFLLLFSIVGLVCTYSTTNHLLGKQVLNTFEQKRAIADNIFRHQEQLLTYSLRSIKSSPEVVRGLSLWLECDIRDFLLNSMGKTTDFPIDILFITTHEDVVFADASSPFFTADAIRSEMIKEKFSLLRQAKIIRVKDDRDLTIQARAVTIKNDKTGKVIGTLFGGTVLNDNTSLLLNIRRETDSAAVTLFSDGAYLASTEKKESEVNNLTVTPKEPINFFSKFFDDDIYSVGNLIFSPRFPVYEQDDTVVEVVFVMPDNILAELRSSYLTMSIVVVVGALFFILSAVLMMRSLTLRSLKRLLSYSDEIAAGVTSCKYQAGKIKEFNQLGHAMENMVIGLQDVNEQLSRDVKARTEAEAALRKSETHLRTLLETIPDLIWLKNEDGVYLSCNREFELFFGASQEEIVGKTDYDFVDKEVADKFRELDKAAMSAGEPVKREENVTYANDGRHVTLETLKVPLFSDEMSLVGVLGIARDITDRKEAEKERKQLELQLSHAHKMEAIGTMAGGIAHDFNNVLAGIIGYSEIAKFKLEDGSPAKKSIEQVIQASNRAKDLVQHILSYSRMSEVEEGLVSVDLVEVLKEVLNFQQSIIPKNIQLETNLENDGAKVLGDPTQLHQVFMNLCTNAWHAMEASGGTLQVALKKVELTETDIVDDAELAAGLYVQVSVADTGVGMPPDVVERIFDPYYTTKAVGKGSGMGLSVVLGIVKKHGGVIKVESRIGQGSSFVVLLPYSTVTQEKQSDQDNVSLPHGDEHLLLVDDEEMLVGAGKIIFENCGYTVTTVTDSLAALELFKENPEQFDLMITDQTMPGMLGSELAQSVLDIRPEFPIILCTGYSSYVDEKSVKEIGIREYTTKPVDTNTILHLIRKVLDNS